MRERYHRLSVQGSGGWRRYGYYSVDYQRRYILHGGWAKRGYTGTPRIGVGKRQRVSGLSSVKKDVISSKGLKTGWVEKGALNKGLVEEGEVEGDSDAKEEHGSVKEDVEGDVEMKDELLEDENYFD
ncbi:hypothetical protein KXX41_006076, partial [Aspergillus fumigatus]